MQPATTNATRRPAASGLAAFAALILIVTGSLVLLTYVRGAEARALAGVRTVEVLVVEQLIPAGTAGDELVELVTTEVLPAKAALPGRVTDLEALAGADTPMTQDMTAVTDTPLTCGPPVTS